MQDLNRGIPQSWCSCHATRPWAPQMQNYLKRQCRVMDVWTLIFFSFTQQYIQRTLWLKLLQFSFHWHCSHVTTIASRFVNLWNIFLKTLIRQSRVLSLKLSGVQSLTGLLWLKTSLELRIVGGYQSHWVTVLVGIFIINNPGIFSGIVLWIRLYSWVFNLHWSSREEAQANWIILLNFCHICDKKYYMV